MKEIKYIVLLVLIFVSSLSFGQSETMISFDKEEGGTHLYFYQSILRILNKDKNPDFDRLVENLEYLKFVMITPEGKVITKFDALHSGLKTEGYEELMSFDRSGYSSIIMENELDGKSNWMVLFIMEGNVGLIEMHGSLDPKYFKAFASLDYSKLEGMIPTSSKNHKD